MDELMRSQDQRQAPTTQSFDKLAYIKLINVPNMLDIGGTEPNPTEEALDLSLIDIKTLGVIAKSLSPKKDSLFEELIGYPSLSEVPQHIFNDILRSSSS